MRLGAPLDAAYRSAISGQRTGIICNELLGFLGIRSLTGCGGATVNERIPASASPRRA
jgi:hypothetical protein